ncbi:MAG: SDR family NAD(P)-dependent oxidoreductase [Reyranellaceae bacterium]
MKLQAGQVAVVTGAASGIGLAVTEALAARGLAVAMIDFEHEALSAAHAGLADRGLAVTADVCDVTDAAAMHALAVSLAERHGRLDLVVNNAGVGGVLGPLWHSRPEDWTWTFGANVHGVVNGLRAFLPALLRQGSGHVVNVASLAGLTAPPFLSPYVASKHAVVGLSESLAAELQAIGSAVRVSVACPGHVASRIRQSERNRRDQPRQPRATPPDLLARLEAGFTQALGEAMPAADFARLLLEGIEADRSMILTHPAQNGSVVARADALKRAAQAP